MNILKCKTSNIKAWGFHAFIVLPSKEKNAYTLGVLIDGELIAAIETDPELWTNRLRITELWVSEKYQKQGIGHSLIEMAKEQARRERHR